MVMAKTILPENIDYCERVFSALLAPILQNISLLEAAIALEQTANRLRRESAEAAERSGEGKLQFHASE